MSSLKEALASARRDDFENGTVVRWKSDAGRDVFLYAAVKTPVGWFTTAREFNSYVPQLVKFDDLLEILARAETTSVSVAKEWEEVI